MSEIIRWEEPPREHGNARPKRASKYQAVADNLRAHPGEWALIVENISPGSGGSLSYRIRNGVNPFDPPRHFDAKLIGPAGGSSSKVYARYVGEVAES